MMLIFWLIITVMIVLALAFVLLPLLRKPKTQTENFNQAALKLYKEQLANLEKDLDENLITPQTYSQLKLEIEQEVLDCENSTKKNIRIAKPSYLTALVLLFLVPIVSLSLYNKWGNEKQLATYYYEKDHAAAIQAEMKKYKNPQQLIAKMQSVLKQHPTSAQGWFLLGRLYSGTMQFNQAESAYENAIKYAPKNLTYKLQYAQASFFANNKKLNGKANSYVKLVLAKEPKNPSAINLLALNAFSQKHYQQAIDYWEQLLNFFPENTKDGKVIFNAIHEAQSRMNQKQ